MVSTSISLPFAEITVLEFYKLSVSRIAAKTRCVMELLSVIEYQTANSVTQVAISIRRKSFQLKSLTKCMEIRGTISIID